jgi:hypothetical protein
MPFASAIQKNMDAIGMSWPHKPRIGSRSAATGPASFAGEVAELSAPSAARATSASPRPAKALDREAPERAWLARVREGTPAPPLGLSPAARAASARRRRAGETTR